MTFHAMLPLIECYGPAAILYPDLWRNPRMDAWLKGTDGLEDASARGSWDALPSYTESTSFAAVIPNSFVALLPAGGADGLPLLRDVANAARERVSTRWKEYAEVVRGFFEEFHLSDDSWRSLWQRQHEDADVVRPRWTAVPWVHSPRMDAFVQAGALPWQAREQLPGESPEDRLRRLERSARLEPWLSREQWEHAERTRYAFGSFARDVLQRERGFDYAVTNAQLRATHQLRKHAAVWPRVAEDAEGGVTCSLCGQRTAHTFASGPGSAAGHVDTLTQKAREFWSHEALDPERLGAERLCAVCATKRLLVKAGKAAGGLNPLWATDADRQEIERDGEARVPFPSTTAISAQGYIARLCQQSDPTTVSALARVVATHRALGWPSTQFPRCLRRLNEVYQGLPEGDPRREFLRREPQELLYPDAIEARLRMEDSKKKRADRGQTRGSPTTRRDYSQHPHVQAVRELLDAAGRAPSSRFAVIKVDGDSLSTLLTGQPGSLHARWEDVIHPELVAKLRRGEGNEAKQWSALLPAERMMGPSLHAFVTRALGEFAHRVAPWVVEQESDGRLIYTGGDDLLALAPAGQALIVARLNQLFSAHWVVDTAPQKDAWSWRVGSGR